MEIFVTGDFFFERFVLLEGWTFFGNICDRGLFFGKICVESKNMDAPTHDAGFEHDMEEMRRTVRARLCSHSQMETAVDNAVGCMMSRNKDLQGRVEKIERAFCSRLQMETAVDNSVGCLMSRNKDLQGRVEKIERDFPSRDEMERAIFNSVKCLHERNEDLSTQVANLQIANQLLHKRVGDLERSSYKR